MRSARWRSTRSRRSSRAPPPPGARHRPSPSPSTSWRRRGRTPLPPPTHPTRPPHTHKPAPPAPCTHASQPLHPPADSAPRAAPPALLYPPPPPRCPPPPPRAPAHTAHDARRTAFAQASAKRERERADQVMTLQDNIEEIQNHLASGPACSTRHTPACQPPCGHSCPCGHPPLQKPSCLLRARPSGPKRSARAAWRPERGCGGALPAACPTSPTPAPFDKPGDILTENAEVGRSYIAPNRLRPDHYKGMPIEQQQARRTYTHHTACACMCMCEVGAVRSARRAVGVCRGTSGPTDMDDRTRHGQHTPRRVLAPVRSSTRPPLHASALPLPSTHPSTLPPTLPPFHPPRRSFSSKRCSGRSS